MLKKYLSKELEQLDQLFRLKFSDYGTSWQEKNINWLLNRLIGEVRELVNAEDFGYRNSLLKEALDCALVALFIAERVNSAERLDSLGRIKTRDNGEK